MSSCLQGHVIENPTFKTRHLIFSPTSASLKIFHLNSRALPSRNSILPVAQAQTLEGIPCSFLFVHVHGVRTNSGPHFRLYQGVGSQVSSWSVCASKSCPTLCDPVDCSSTASSVHGILQARTLERVAISFSRGSSRSRDRLPRLLSLWSGKQILNHWAAWEAHYLVYYMIFLIFLKKRCIWKITWMRWWGYKWTKSFNSRIFHLGSVNADLWWIFSIFLNEQRGQPSSLILAVSLTVTNRWSLFSHSVVSDSLRPHGLQHARLLLSLSPRACSNSCPLSRWHRLISSQLIQPSHPLSPTSPALKGSQILWDYNLGVVAVLNSFSVSAALASQRLLLALNPPIPPPPLGIALATGSCSLTC